MSLPSCHTHLVPIFIFSYCWNNPLWCRVAGTHHWLSLFWVLDGDSDTIKTQSFYVYKGVCTEMRLFCLLPSCQKTISNCLCCMLYLLGTGPGTALAMNDNRWSHAEKKPADACFGFVFCFSMYIFILVYVFYFFLSCNMCPRTPTSCD